MKPASAFDFSLPRLESRLKAAIESECFEEAMTLLAEYSACVADLLESHGPCDRTPTREEVIGLLTWASRMLLVIRAHALDEYVVLSDYQLYAGPVPVHNTWQVML